MKTETPNQEPETKFWREAIERYKAKNQPVAALLLSILAYECELKAVQS